MVISYFKNSLIVTDNPLCGVVFSGCDERVYRFIFRSIDFYTLFEL